jgi:tetratricopeptide (TPR) repeat protein
MQGDYDRAIADYTEAIRRDPEQARAYCRRGGAYRMQGDYDRAIADASQAIRLAPKHPRAYCIQGHACYMKGDYDRAIADASMAMRLDPKYAWAYYRRGVPGPRARLHPRGPARHGVLSLTIPSGSPRSGPAWRGNPGG